MLKIHNIQSLFLRAKLPGFIKFWCPTFCPQTRLKLHWGEYRTSKEKGKLSHREVIDSMAERGWKYVDHIPVGVGGYGNAAYIDLVFEKDVEE